MYISDKVDLKGSEAQIFVSIKPYKNCKLAMQFLYVHLRYFVQNGGKSFFGTALVLNTFYIKYTSTVLKLSQFRTKFLM